MKFKGIMSRIILSVVPIVILSIVLLALIVSRLMWAQINDQINKQMAENLKKAELSIRNEFSKNAAIAQSLAAYAQVSGPEAVERGEMKDFVMGIIQTNANTFAGGIWYEPQAYLDKPYFSAYAHKQGNSPIYEPDYGATVNYHAEPWYIRGKSSKGETIWSDVYDDPVASMTIITAAVPFFDKEGKIRGLGEVDMSLKDIRKIMQDISLGASGKAFILGGEGEFIAFYDDSRKLEDKITNDRNSSLAAFGKEVLRNKEGSATVKMPDGENRAYYTTIPETKWSLVVMMNNSEVRGTIAALVLASITAPIVGLAIATLCVFLVALYLRRIAKKINNFAILAAGGDFSKRIAITEADEFGILEGHLNQMVENMSAVYVSSMATNDKILDSARRFSSLAAQTENMVKDFSANVDEMGSNLNALARAGENVNTAVKEVAIGAQATAEKGTDIAHQVESALQAGEDGRNAVRQVVKNNETVAKDVSTAAESIRELSVRTRQIQNFVTQIGGIADQTNLLALNAAIEAARAGDFGRGFAVVAEEVRKLAEESNAAAKNIASLADTITGDLDNVVSISQGNAKASQEAQNLSSQTEKILDNMIGYLKGISGATQDLAAVSQEQAAASGEIAEAVTDISAKVSDTAQASENIRRTVSEVTSSAELMAQGAQDLSSLSDDMKATFETFKLEDAENTGNIKETRRSLPGRR
ncbi:MAG: methyl-accepting chemotaxis protein [Synergistaceae bacterium]|nr:methyl-accepting chemotaxis protein [Synergistaceae bacterium]